MATNDEVSRELVGQECPESDGAHGADEASVEAEDAMEDGCATAGQDNLRLRRFAQDIIETCEVLDITMESRSTDEWTKPELRMLATHRQRIENVLRTHGFQRMSSLGERLDVDLMDVLQVTATHVPEEDETVACVVLPGYRLNGHPVRRELVVVGKFVPVPAETASNQKEVSNG